MHIYARPAGVGIARECVQSDRVNYFIWSRERDALKFNDRGGSYFCRAYAHVDTVLLRCNKNRPLIDVN